MSRSLTAVVAGAVVLVTSVAHADALQSLREFSTDVRSARAAFTQTVTSPDGKRTKTSAGEFEFARPDRFRFAYKRPFEQLIVGDGQKVWIFDPDLNQASSRRMSQAVGATPAALLAGASLEKDFDLSALPDRDGLSWVQALPKSKEGTFQSISIGFRGSQLAAIDLVDNFGQRSSLRFDAVEVNASVDPARFHFVPPPGAEVLEQ
jgi:outer membrane lipoprotein carrier protein